MKKIALFLAVFGFLWSSAQNKKIVFSKELKYTFVDDKSKNQNVEIDIFGNNSNELLLSSHIDQLPLNLFIDNLGVSTVSFKMNNQLENSIFSSIFSQLMYSAPEQKSGNLEINKIAGTETILGIPCQYYTVNFVDKSKEESMKICINENHPINTFSALTGVLKVFTKTSYSNSLKGLILKGGPNTEKFDKEYFVLKSIKDSDAYVYFNHQESMMKHQRKMDSLMMEQKKWEEDYAISDSAVVADSAMYDGDYAYIPEYVSTYKKENSVMPNLSIHNPSSKNLLKGAPKYCSNLDKDFPVFEHKEIATHLKNYAGQVCDMYLTQSYEETVDEKGTMDEIRREVLYLLDVRDKLSKSDKKKLDKYLNKLD